MIACLFSQWEYDPTKPGVLDVTLNRELCIDLATRDFTVVFQSAISCFNRNVGSGKLIQREATVQEYQELFGCVILVHCTRIIII